MSTSPLMSLGIRAMAANYAALQATGHNIANANVAGYSRQSVDLATAQGQFTGAGFFGRGVNVQTVARAHNEFLTREAASARSLSAMDSARLTQLKGLENIFQPGEAGLGFAATELFDSMVDMSSHPSDLATRQVVLARAGDLVSRFNEAGAALNSAQASVTSELTTAVADINSLARAIAAANQQIASLRGLGQPANDLLDERERLIGKLSDQVQVTRIEAEDGSLSVFIGGGQRLVLGADAAQLQVMRDINDPSRSAIGVVEGGQPRMMEDTAFGGGAVAGLLRFQNNDLVAGRNLVGQMATAVASAVNSQQMRGLNLQAPLGQVASQALFGLGAPQALPHASNARDALGVPLGSVSLTVVDASLMQASDYSLTESTTAPGSWELVRLSDSTRFTVNSGDVVDGMRIDVANAQGGDRFLLQPVGRAASGMTRLLSNPRDLAAASPLVATTAPTNTGTVAVGQLTVTASPLPVPGGTTRITFTSDTGDYNVDILDAGGNVVGSGSGTWLAGQTLPPAGSDFNGFTLQFSGVPRNGDVINVLPTPAAQVAQNNGNALSLLALRDAALVNGRTSSDAWAHALADVGVRVQSGQSASDLSTAVAEQAEQQRSSQAGVNLDEEAARLIQFQQSYQAAAKVLQVAQSLFDTLLQAAAR